MDEGDRRAGVGNTQQERRGARDDGVERERDTASRGLALMARMLPAHRRDWWLAMRAELATLDGAVDRRRYAASCARAVLTDPGAVCSLVGRASVLAGRPRRASWSRSWCC